MGAAPLHICHDPLVALTARLRLATILYPTVGYVVQNGEWLFRVIPALVKPLKPPLSTFRKATVSYNLS
jgi:hypothetical protein